MGRAPCCEKIGIKKGRWTAEEDELLSKYIEANGEGSWRSLPKNAGLKRCGKSCRLRWINYLRSDLKRGNITPEEEDTIIKMHITLGNRWSLIAAHLPGRTDNEIKNYWNSHLSRRIQTFRRPIGESLPKIMIDIVKIKGECKRRGRTSRAAMKKNIIKNNPQKIQPIVKKVFVNKNNTSEGEESIASGIIPSSTALKEEALKDDKECQNTLVEGPNLGNENIGILFKASEEGESVRSSSLNGDSDDGLLGPCQAGLESCMLFGEDIIMGEGVLSSSGVLPLNEEKQNGGVISSLSEGQLVVLGSSSNGIMASSEERESGGISSSNGAAESSEWYSSCAMTSCFEDDCWINWDWEAGVVEDPENNYKFLSNEGEELVTWLWDNDDSCKSGEMFMECEEQNKALAAWLLS